MRCARYRKLIDLLLDGALERETVSQAEAHLKTCKGCRSYHDQGLRLRQLIQSSPRPQYPEWLHHRIMDECRRHESQRVTYQKRSRLQLVPAAMAVMLSLFLGSMVGKNAFETHNTSASSIVQSSDELSYSEHSLVDGYYYQGGSSE